ncbi:hypothetical protein M1O53_03280 [Dehalococcoidia bacterium]|nr:hypothetical protein [Dehalococcoidia bacterium]MCL0093986.1 hypothetical protein [Dehalococcoidia bacterium]
MKQLPFQTRMEVLDFYLQGLSADKVSEKTGVSKGAVISILFLRKPERENTLS